MESLCSELNSAVQQLQLQIAAVDERSKPLLTELATLRAKTAALNQKREKLEKELACSHLLQLTRSWHVQQAAALQTRAREALAPLLQEERATERALAARQTGTRALTEQTAARRRQWEAWCSDRRSDGMESVLSRQVRDEEDKVRAMKERRAAVPAPATLSCSTKSVNERCRAVKLRVVKEEENLSALMKLSSENPATNGTNFSISPENCEEIDRIEQEIENLRQKIDRNRAWLSCNNTEDLEIKDDIDVGGPRSSSPLLIVGDEPENTNPVHAIVGHNDQINLISQEQTTEGCAGHIQDEETEDGIDNGEVKAKKESKAVAAARARLEASLRKRTMLSKRVDELEKTLADKKKM
ncbi:uncharacterized protein LOC108676184 [Hyalella azteca]|uniref:Uncharacterized protein LOC108676184 n=1 Tax=Hyalella azteca TaxID=294128 RepID=A0A8B7P0V2_HYAAZ|nr:uncharacterized protein LOC108676184 [Hyalella azteca]